MKLLNSEFTTEEIILIGALLIFFLWVFIGGFAFSLESRLFPMILTIPGTFLLLLYLVRGMLPSSIESMIASDDRFSIGKPMSSADNSSVESGEKKPIKTGQLNSYFIFFFTFAFIATAFLTGFYASTIIMLPLYMFVSRRTRSVTNRGIVALMFCVLLVIYIFDRAFGHNFGEGAFLSLPWF